MLDSFIGSSRLDDRKPYSFSSYYGDTFLEAHQSARSTWTASLRAEGATLDRFPAVLDPRAPRDDDERRHTMDAWLQRTATETLEQQPLDAGAWSERIGRAHVEAGLPLREDPHGNWGFRTIERWVQRFEAFGCIHTLYDGDGRRVVQDPNRTGVLVRLAFATAWATVSAVDVEQSVILLNALLKIDDLVQAQVTHAGATLTAEERDLVLATITLERRALERVSSRAGQLAEETTS